VRGPRTVTCYAIATLRGRAADVAGHNPVGGWSVLLMLACVFVQSVSGLFASDDLTETGPLAARVSDATVSWMTRVHEINRYVLLLLIAIHLTAVAMHWVVRRHNLVAPMLHGRGKPGAEPMRAASSWLALALLIASLAAVAAIVVLGGD
jgi:cytochrome b